MSLKAFHFFFIVVAILLALGFATWSLLNYFSPAGRRSDLIWGVGSVVVALGLAGYEAYFLKKFKKVSYL
jgi:hypothetical protein